MNLMRGREKDRCIPKREIRRRRRGAALWSVQVDAAASVGDDVDERRRLNSRSSRSWHGRCEEDEGEKGNRVRKRGAPHCYL